MKTKQNHNRKAEGLVISYYGSTVLVQKPAGEVLQCHLRRNQSLPVVGDYVTYEHDPKQADRGTVTGILPRKSLLQRYEGRPGKMKAIAANLDVLVIVMSPPPIFSEYLIDRYLVAAELLALPAAIVVNKIDLVQGEELLSLEKRLQPYRALDYPVILSSALRAHGLDSLKSFLASKTAVLVGPSGVGKSSIIANCAGLDTIPIGEVSTKGSGKHTTTATRLYTIATGGSLIDSPGVREFNLWPVDQEALKKGFKEIDHFTGQCKFSDCQHLAEPGCGVQAAVLDGKISRERLENYHALWQKMKQPRY